jgi:hypothetical protein
MNLLALSQVLRSAQILKSSLSGAQSTGYSGFVGWKGKPYIVFIFLQHVALLLGGGLGFVVATLCWVES